MRLNCLLAVVLITVWSYQAAAQSGPFVYTSGSATESVEADLATLTVQFSATRDSPMDAGQACAERANAIRRALVGLGIPSDSIVTGWYSSRLQTDLHRTDTTFVAQNTMVARIRDFSLIGAAIDTALAEGATSVQGPRFVGSNTDGAQRRALVAATKTARARAEAMASALGLELGDLQEVTTEYRGTGYWSELSLSEVVVTGSAGASTTIQAPQQQVSATVYARWQVVSPGTSVGGR